MSSTGKKDEFGVIHSLSRRDFLRLIAWTGGGAALSSFLASCAPAITAATASAAPSMAAPTATVVSMTATPTGPKILTARMATDIAGIDPAFMVGLTDSLVSDCVFSGLIHQKPGSYEWENDLAESISVSDDGLTVSFTLKQGVMFHKGYGELTTEDVKFSFERIADPANKSPYSSDWLTLDHVEATDKYNGKIILKSPFAPLFTSTLPVNSGRIVCKTQVDKEGEKTMTLNPVGSGLYIFDSWTPNQKIVLKRNPAYFGTPAFFDEIDLIPITDDLAAETAIQAGELDISTISLGDTSRFLQNTDLTVDKKDALYYYWVGLDVENPKLADINVRQAIRYGIDVNQILTAVYFGQATRGNSMIPPGLIGYWADAPQYDRDVTKAKGFLSKAGLTTMDLTYACPNDTLNKAQAEVIQQNLAEVGINVTINQMDISAYYAAGTGDNGKNLELFADVFSMYPDPAWATMWFTSDQIGVWNWMRWKSTDFDNLATQGITTLDSTKRNDIYIQMQKLMDNDCIAIWITHGAVVHAFKKNILPIFTPNGQDQLWNDKSA